MKALAIVAVSAATVLGLAGASSARPLAAPRVWVADRSPIVVAASGFGSRQPVALTLTAGGTRYTKTVKSTTAGRARAQWAGSIRIDACHLVIVTAVAANGRRATYKSPRGGIECAPIQPISQ
jgi:hypothetical protein